MIVDDAIAESTVKLGDSVADELSVPMFPTRERKTEMLALERRAIEMLLDSELRRRFAGYA